MSSLLDSLEKTNLSVLQCVAVGCSESQRVVDRRESELATRFARENPLKCLEVCCSVLQCVAVSCSAL